MVPDQSSATFSDNQISLYIRKKMTVDNIDIHFSFFDLNFCLCIHTTFHVAAKLARSYLSKYLLSYEHICVQTGMPEVW